MVDDMNGEDFVIHAAIRGPDAEAAGQMLKENNRRSTCLCCIVLMGTSDPWIKYCALDGILIHGNTTKFFF